MYLETELLDHGIMLQEEQTPPVCTTWHYVWFTFRCCSPVLLFVSKLSAALTTWFFFLISSPPQRPMTSDFEGFLYQILSITLFSYLNLWERASIFPLQCWVLNKVTTGTIFITSLVWRGPWLGIEPWTSRTRSQHSTTRLSRRR